MKTEKEKAIEEIRKLKEYASWQIVRNGKEPTIPYDHKDYRARNAVISYLIWKHSITRKELESTQLTGD